MGDREVKIKIKFSTTLVLSEGDVRAYLDYDSAKKLTDADYHAAAEVLATTDLEDNMVGLDRYDVDSVDIKVY